MYTLDNSFTRYRFKVLVVGCGGTGGFAAEGLCRILPAEATLVLVDHDHVEERNLVRQNFTREELGRNKSEVLACRLSHKYSRAIAYSTQPIGPTPVTQSDIIIGCVDNGPARRDIAEKFGANLSFPSPFWWIDAGNGENYGQVLIGNCPYKEAGTRQVNEYNCHEDGNVWRYLPLPTVQRPDLLAQQPAQASCAENAEQGPTINQGMAALVVEVVRRLIEGTCPWVQLYLDMNMGTLQPVFATREAIEDIIGKRISREGGGQ